MKNIIILGMPLLTISSSYAQLTKPCSGSGCSDDVDNTDTYNVAKTTYDHNFRYGNKAWQDREWHIYYKISGGSNQQEPIISPFFNGNGNTEGIAADGNSDFRPEDGWELVYTNLGGESGSIIEYTEGPAIIFYNKYKSVLRVMLYITQLFSETGGEDAATIRLAFSGNYQSAALTHHEGTAKALGNFKNNVVLSGINDFPANSNQWLTADFPIAYDPCTCQNERDMKLRVDAVVYNKGSVDIRIDPVAGTPETEKKNSGNILTAVASSLQAGDGGALAGAIKNYEKASKAVDDMEKWGQKLFPDASLQIKISDELQTIGDNVGSFSRFLAQVGPFSSATMGLFNFFVNGGSKSSRSFQPVAIVNSMKASGSITYSSIKNQTTFDVPGSIRGSTAKQHAIYNNTMGIMNLVETPEVEVVSAPGTSQIKNYLHLISPIKYVVNPTAGLRLKDIKAAIVLENYPHEYVDPPPPTPGSAPTPTTSYTRYVKEGGGARTNYFPLDCLVNQRFESASRIPGGSSIPPIRPKIIPKLKIMAIFEREDDPTADEVLFIATYEVKTTYGATGVINNATFASNNLIVNTEQDVVLDASSYNLSENVLAANTITAQNTVINGSVSLSAEEVLIDRNTTIGAGMTIEGGLAKSEGCDNVAPLCPSEVAAFCNSSEYSAQVP